MKQDFLNIIVIVLLALMGFLSACINDDELEFPEDRSDEVKSSPELFTFLNYVQHSSNSFDCFSIVFPVELGYNNGVIISIDDKKGLIEALENQTSTFYVEGVVLPVLVNKQGVLSSLESASDIDALLDYCEIPALFQIFDDFESQCFEFVFPISLIESNDTLYFESEDEYDIYEDLQGDDFSLSLVFPIKIERYSTNEIINVFNYFELYELVSNCEGCPEASIVIDPEFNGKYWVKAIYKESKLPISNKWFIDEEFIAESKDSIYVELPDGDYEICVKSFNADCLEGEEICRTVEVENACPVLFFQKEKNTDVPGLYYFYADFDLKDEISYWWVVYQNDVALYFEEEFPDQSDGKLSFQFDLGTYTVCLEKENVNESCQLAQYCEEIIIE